VDAVPYQIDVAKGMNVAMVLVAVPPVKYLLNKVKKHKRGQNKGKKQRIG